MNQKQHCIPGGIVGIRATITDLKDTWVVVSTTSPFNSPLWPGQNTDGLWRMTADKGKLSQVVNPSAAAGPDMMCWSAQVRASPGACCATIDLANILFLSTCP